MKATELMLGDIVRYRSYICKVYLISQLGIDLEDLNGEIYWVSTDKVEPIPLTPKILELNGWRCYKTISSSNWALSGLYIDGNCGCYKMFIGSNNNTIKLNYVHQLQHLLRACGYDDLADNFLVK